MPEISILIPCHNSERWLARAIQSALDDHSNHEVVVVDDGSSDNSRDIAAEFGSRIRLISQPQTGGNAARNRLLQEAGGSWVQFLDADDELKPDKISRQLEEFNSGQADVLVGGVVSETWREGKVVARETCAIGKEEDLIERWLAWRFPQTGGLLWRREPLIGIGGWKEGLSCCQDFEVVMRAIQKGLRFAVTSHSGAVYRLWSEQTLSRKNIFQTVEMRTSLTMSMWGWLESVDGCSDVRRRALGRSLFEMSRTLAKYDVKKAEEYYHRYRNDMYITGPAAPWHYRIARQILGFRYAEQLADMVRREF